VGEYNTARPHQSCGGHPPIERFRLANGSLAGFSCHVGASYAGEPVEAVVAGGLVDILHAGVVAATHAQRLRGD